jgi:predicted Zn-dependent peptidase
VIDGELSRLAREPASVAELARAFTKQEAAFIRSLETGASRAGYLQMANHYTHDPQSASRILARYRAVTTASMAQAAQKWLGAPHLVLSVVPSPEAPLCGRVITQSQEKK